MTNILRILFTLYLSFNLNKGSLLELSDGSRWIINPDDTAFSVLWLQPSEIDVQESKDQTYPYKLTNWDTKQSVRAKKQS